VLLKTDFIYKDLIGSSWFEALSHFDNRKADKAFLSACWCLKVSYILDVELNIRDVLEDIFSNHKF